MKRCYCTFRDSQHYSQEAFAEGLARVGYKLVDYIRDPTHKDLLLIWNRSTPNHVIANRYEAVGARVLVAENGYTGKQWRGEQWFALALHNHNGVGEWRFGGNERWDNYGVELAPFRANLDGHTLILGQRGIGAPGIASPNGWDADTLRRAQDLLPPVAQRSVRVRPHPGKDEGPVSLEQALSSASFAVTWGSGAALRALMLGVPVYYGLPMWIGGVAGRYLYGTDKTPNISEPHRLAMFRHLAWAQWSKTEIRSGLPFATLLEV